MYLYEEGIIHADQLVFIFTVISYRYIAMFYFTVTAQMAEVVNRIIGESVVALLIRERIRGRGEEGLPATIPRQITVTNRPTRISHFISKGYIFAKLRGALSLGRVFRARRRPDDKGATKVPRDYIASPQDAY